MNLITIAVVVNTIAIVCCSIAAYLNFMAGNTPLGVIMVGLVGMNTGLLITNLMR